MKPSLPLGFARLITPCRWGRTRFFCFGSILAAAGLATVTAATYLHLPGAPGDSQDPDHKNWIEVRAVRQQGIKPAPDDTSTPTVRFTKLTDQASPLLGLALVQERVFPSARMEFVATGPNGRRVLDWVLKDVRIVGIDTAFDAATGETAAEQVTVIFERLRWTYTASDPEGGPGTSRETEWDLAAGEASNHVLPRRFEVGASWAGGVAPLHLRWLAQADRTYEISSSARVDGGFALLKEVTVTETGEVDLPRPGAEPWRFFRVTGRRITVPASVP